VDSSNTMESNRQGRPGLSLDEWVVATTRRELLLASGSAVALALLGAFVVFLTFWAIYGIIGFGFHWLLPISHRGLMTAAGVIVILLFVGNATTAREYLDRIELDLGPRHRPLVMALAIGSGHGWALAFAGPKTARSSVKMFTTLLYTGPRMLTAAVMEARRALRLREVDEPGCAKVLGTLLSAQRRVSFEELVEKHPSLPLEQIIPQLSDFEGVVFLRSEPAGMTLAPLLVEEIIAWRTQTAES
jgi:hypothetical protein